MSHVKSGNDGGGLGQDKKSHYRCRIPQRLGPGRLRPPCKSKFNNQDQMQINRFEVANAQRNLQTSRPRSAEVARPKSAARVKEEPGAHPWAYTPAHPMQLVRSARPDKERSVPALKRPSYVPRRTNVNAAQKNGTQVLAVPPQRNIVASEKNFRHDSQSEDFDSFIQDTLSKCGENECGAYSNSTHPLDSKDSDKVMQLRVRWQENIVNFENIKQGLSEMQRVLVEQYATLQATHAQMTEVGERVRLPPVEGLRIMNVSRMTPEQLLRLCEGADVQQNPKSSVEHTCSAPVAVKELYDMPNHIISTCEQSLLCREQMISWFEEIISQKAITKNALVRKLEQFKDENSLLKNTLHSNKNILIQNINATVEILEKSVSDAVANQLRAEELVCKLADLNSKNEDLRKQLRTTENRVSNKARLEEMEKDLKDEKCKKMVLKERLSRAESQLRAKEERASQLEPAWEQAQAKTMALERTVYQLREENKQLKAEHDEQIRKLTESIKENIQNLEDIAANREKLATEKEDLEKRLSELSEHYKESLKDVKNENSLQITKLIEYEKKHSEVLQEKVKLESKVETLCAQLIESELRFKDLWKKLTAAESQLSESAECRQEIDATRRKLDKANSELLTLQNLLMKKTEAFDQLENNFKKSVEAEEILKSDLHIKEEYISELEKQRSLLEQRLKESECKLESYADQLSELKVQISRLLKDFGEFENLDELHKMVDQQRQELQKAIEQNSVLTQALRKQQEVVEQQVGKLAEQGQLLEQREAMLATLSEKDEEQSNIIKLLRKNFEIRAQADVDLNQQIVEKSTEIESLISNLEARKEQISQLEKIILALEEQTRKSNIQKRKDKDTILLLRKKLSEYESYFMANGRNHETPADNLDHLINMLENELGNPFDNETNNKDSGNSLDKRQSGELNKRDKQLYHRNSPMYQQPREKRPTKIVMGNYVKKTYIANEDHHKHDSLNRKKAITSMETQKWLTSPDPELNGLPKLNVKHLASFKGVPTRAPYSLLPSNLVDEKKCKMFKLAGHRL